MVDQNSQFYAILTDVGAAKQANADALGIAWKITQMGVGDANGTDPTPNASQKSLINEWRRAALNQLKVDDKNSAVIVAEQVIPADVGGKWIREIGLYDDDGDLVAVANCAPTYKPLLSQGSGRTQVVRLSLVVSSSSNVQLKIDPSVVLATREFVTDELARQDFKYSVLAATTAPLTLSGLQTVDGVALQAGSRVLVKDQEASKDNGLYLVAAGAWSRSSDADTNAKVTPGLFVLVEKGSINGDSGWQLITDGLITLGVTGLTFEMAFGRTGVAAGTYRSVTVDKYGRVVAATNPTTVAGYGLTDVYTRTQIDSSLALKAPLRDAAFEGTPTAPTPVAGSNTQQLATTAFVQDTVARLIAGAPGALDTLKELADAMGNDPNFATTVLNALRGKADRGTSLEAYGILDDVQLRKKELTGAFTVECLDVTEGVQTTGLLIKTNIPVLSSVMPLLTIKGALNGYTSPFEAVLSWYFVEGAVYAPLLLVKGSSVDLDTMFNASISHSNGLYNIRLDFGRNAYIPRLAVTAQKSRAYGGEYAYYKGWTSSVSSTAIAGEVRAVRHAVLTTANVSQVALALAREGVIPLSAVTDLAGTLAGKAAKVHDHLISDVSGLGQALNLASGLAAGGTDQDPNVASTQVIVTTHVNAPSIGRGGIYWHITTSFFERLHGTSNRAQIAVQYNGGSRVYSRACFQNVWSEWERLDNQAPAGSVLYFAGANPPEGYIKANGAVLNRTTYAKLYAAIGNSAGAGDGSTTFAVPDLRGEFIRGWDDGRGVDPNRAFASVQLSQNLSHAHSGMTDSQGLHSHAVSGSTSSGGAHSHTMYRALNSNVGAQTDRVTTAQGDGGIATPVVGNGDHSHTITGTADAAGAHAHNLSIYAEGGSEARPRNYALLACIKY